jgi:site-specific DNA recombinase
LEKIEAFARLGGHDLVPISEADYDLDVSGSVSPFVRPGLGPWLREDRLQRWDAIVVAKFDRLTRSLFDFVTLMSWLDARGKTLMCVDPALDLSTPVGRAFASIAATFAQFERETIAARVRDAWHELRDSGKYGGGQVPFGYRPARLEKGWGYEPDPAYGPIVTEMFDRYVRAQSLGTITRWLNDSRVPTSWDATRKRNGKPVKNSMWKVTSVRKILGSQAALGATIKTDGTLVRDEDGMVVYRAEALVGRDVWERAQARLAANSSSARVNTWLLTRVAFCAVCEGPMYGAMVRSEGKTYSYYGCMHSMRRDGICTARRVKASELEAAVTNELLAFAGNSELAESKDSRRCGLSEQISRVVAQMTGLYGEIQLGALSGADVAEKQGALQRTQDELKRLHALELAEAELGSAGSGQTFRQQWESLDGTGRNEILRRAAIRALVSRDALPGTADREGPSVQFGHPRTVIIDRPDLHAVIDFGCLGERLVPCR